MKSTLARPLLTLPLLLPLLMVIHVHATSAADVTWWSVAHLHNIYIFISPQVVDNRQYERKKNLTNQQQ